MRSVEKNFKMSVIHPSRDDLTQCNLLLRSINKNCDAASITTFLLLNHCLTNVLPKRNWKQRLRKIWGGGGVNKVHYGLGEKSELTKILITLY